jgi:type II secretory pathway pseudopilin PulG
MARGGTQSAGFTILETLIVLAVSSTVAISTIVAVSGRQSKTEFMVGANDMKQKVEQIINETRNGYFPGAGFTCTGSPVGNTKPVITPPAQGQGTNDSCIFLGKAVEFGVPDSTTYATYPLVGRRQVRPASINQEVSAYTGVNGANPIALAYSPTAGASPVDRSEVSQTRNNLKFKKATYHYGASTQSASYAVFAFADNLSGYVANATSGDLSSTTEDLNLYYFSGSPVWSTPPGSGTDVIDGINSGNVNDTGAALKSLDLCFDGGTGKYAIITINGLGQLSVKLKISDTAC